MHGHSNNNAIKPRTITDQTTNSMSVNGHTHEIQKASEERAGITKVIDKLDSKDKASALSAAQGKVLADMIKQVSDGSSESELNKRLEVALSYLSTRYTASYATLGNANKNIKRHPENALIFVVNDPDLANTGLWIIQGGVLVKAPYDVLASAYTSDSLRVFAGIMTAVPYTEIEYLGQQFLSASTLKAVVDKFELDGSNLLRATEEAAAEHSRQISEALDQVFSTYTDRVDEALSILQQQLSTEISKHEAAIQSFEVESADAILSHNVKSARALEELRSAIEDVGNGIIDAQAVVISDSTLDVFASNQKTNLKDINRNVGTGGDDSQAFLDAYNKTSNYFIPSGTYRVDSSKVDINTHNFTADSNVKIIIDGFEKDYSNAQNGALLANNNGNYVFWKNAKSEKNIARWANGLSASDSHQFYLPLEVRADGHGFMLRQVTRGAGLDILYQDELSDDLFYLAVNGTTDNCSFDISYDTTPKVNGQGGGVGGFESALQVLNTLGSAKVLFKSAPIEVNQSLNFKRRSGATRNYQFVSNTTAGLDLKVQDATGVDIATLMNFRENQVTAGLHTTFVGAYTQTASQRKVFSVIDGGAIANTVKKTYPIATGVGDRVLGEFSVIYVSSTGNIFTRTTRFKANGSTVVFEESALNDVLPTALIADVVYESDGLNLVLHNNGYSASMRFTVKLDWVQTYY